MRITIGTYADNAHYHGWIEPHDRSWIVFLRKDGGHDYFGAREKSGACA